MSVKTKLARQAVTKTVRHTAFGTASRLTRKPFRSLTLVGLGVVVGGIVGFLIGRSGGGDGFPEPPAGASRPTSAMTGADNSTARASETGAAS